MSIGSQSTSHERKKSSLPPAAKAETTATPAIGETRDRMICEAAYYLALQRGFSDGRALEDWLQAENQIDTLLARRNAGR